MGWGRYLFLGTYGQQLDLQDHEADLRRVRQSIVSSRYVERDFAAQIESLSKENEELRIYLTALISLLISKAVITPEEMSRLVEAVERSAEPAAQPPDDPAPQNSSNTSPELADLRRAVEEQDRSG
jgi:hypothetical protein